MRYVVKTTLMIGASALAFSLATPGVALASGECGPPNAAADPNLASCIGDPNEYANGITYNQRSEEHTSELQSLMRISYAVFCLKQKTTKQLDNKTQTSIY